MERTEKIVKPSQPKPIAPKKRARTCATTQKVKEKTKKIEQGGQEKKRPRIKYIVQLDSEEEKIESDEISQFKVVSHNPLSDL